MSQIPQTRRGRALVRLSGWVWIASIVGITFALGTLLSQLLDVGFDLGRANVSRLAVNGLSLCGWCLICFVCYRASRRNETPASWSILAVVGLVWAALLLNRAG